MHCIVAYNWMILPFSVLNVHVYNIYIDDGKLDKFLDHRNTMIEKVSNLKDTMKKAKDMEKSSNSVNPKDLIQIQSKVRIFNQTHRPDQIIRRRRMIFICIVFLY